MNLTIMLCELTLHIIRKEVGRFSSGGAQYAAGVATKLQSKVIYSEFRCAELCGIPLRVIVRNCAEITGFTIVSK